jgi:hypothetical protein
MLTKMPYPGRRAGTSGSFLVKEGWKERETLCAYPLVNGKICPSVHKEGMWESGGTAPLILNLGLRWTSVFNITL